MASSFRTLLLCVASWIAGCTAAEIPQPRTCQLRVGTSGDYAPFSIRDERGARSGLDIAIAKRLAGDLDCSVEFVDFSWPTLLAQLERGEFDLAISGITMRAERSLVGIFSRPYATTGVVAIAAPGASLDNLASLDRPATRLAVNRGGHLERWTRHHLPKANLRTVDDNRSLPNLLSAGEVDAMITDTAEATGWQRHGRLLGPFSTDYKALLLAPGRDELAARLDQWLVDRESDGWLAAARQRHLGDTQASGIVERQQAVAALVRARLALMPMVARSKRTIAKKVTDRGQEKRVIERARSWSTATDDRIATLYALFIDLAKRIQNRTTDERPGPPLDQLRGAIAGVDRQLVREIDRLPQAGVSAWLPVLQAALTPLPLSRDEITEVAAALAAAKQPAN